MNRFTLLRRLLAVGFVMAAVVVACRTSEAPPLGPRPEPVTPSSTPVPGAADPIRSPPGPLPRADAAVLPAPTLVPGAMPAQFRVNDAGLETDAAPPPVDGGGIGDAFGPAVARDATVPDLTGLPGDASPR